MTLCDPGVAAHSLERQSQCLDESDIFRCQLPISFSTGPVNKFLTSWTLRIVNRNKQTFHLEFQLDINGKIGYPEVGGRGEVLVRALRGKERGIGRVTLLT